MTGCECRGAILSWGMATCSIGMEELGEGLAGCRPHLALLLHRRPNAEQTLEHPWFKVSPSTEQHPGAAASLRACCTV